MLAGSPMPSVICKMSQSLLRNTRFICTLFTASMIPSPVLNSTCHGNSLAQHAKEKQKLQEGNEKKMKLSIQILKLSISV